jgi:hypothetical protein
MKFIDLLCVATWHTYDLVNVNYKMFWSIFFTTWHRFNLLNVKYEIIVSLCCALLLMILFIVYYSFEMLYNLGNYTNGRTMLSMHFITLVFIL